MKRIVKKFFILIAILSWCGAIAGLGLYSLQDNISFFYYPSQLPILEEGEYQDSLKVRVGGLVKNGSVKRIDKVINFVIYDETKSIEVEYEGILPPLFKEGKGVVVQGKIAQDKLIATEVLAKHDENYRADLNYE